MGPARGVTQAEMRGVSACGRQKPMQCRLTLFAEEDRPPDAALLRLVQLDGVPQVGQTWRQASQHLVARQAGDVPGVD